MKIGQVIRHLRLERKATLEAIAFIAETDAANLSRIERGKQNATPEILEKVAQAFDFPVSSLYLMAEQNIETYQLDGTKEELKQARQRLDTFVSRFMLLSAANQDLINAFLEVMLRAERKQDSTDAG